MVETAETFQKQLNPEQWNAVQTTEGPVLILAGAGSGKTRVLTYRIAYLLLEKGVKPSEVLAVTFTKKAAGEMRERVQSFFPNMDGLWIGTFHSIFSKIIRWEAHHLGYNSNFVIYDTDDQVRLLKTLMEENHVSPTMHPPKSILATISKAKNKLITPDQYAKQVATPFEEAVSKLFPKYQTRLWSNNACDFDDLITLPIRLFEQVPGVLEKYQSRFKYFLVDEYQDTNKAQYKLMHALAKTSQNICVVGDDDQSIYGWRGADIRNILDFEKDYPQAKTFRLEQNYRSTQNILQAANSVVEKNADRKAKTLWSDNGKGEMVEVHEVENERSEALKVVEHIKQEVFKKKRTFSDFAILYRTNAQSRALEEGLRRSSMSYIIVGGVRFYERKEIKDVLAYLKVIDNPKDSVSLKRIINFPLRGIGDVSVQKLEKWALEMGVTLTEATSRVVEIPDIGNRGKQAILAFSQLIQKYIDLKGKISLNELVHTLIEEVGLLSMYKQDPSIESQSRAENIQELMNGVHEYVNETADPSLSGFLEDVALVTDVDGWDNRSNAITLMTLHSAKGLEFPVVFICGLEDGLFPVSRSLDDPDAMEEERRLFYVGITRAKEKVYISYAQQRNLYGEGSYRMRSRFLDELDPDVVDVVKKLVVREPFVRRPSQRPSLGSMAPKSSEDYFDAHPDYENFSQEVPMDNGIKKGALVRHATFGAGKIISVQGQGKMQKLTVRFENGVEKKLLTQFAKLTLI